VWQKRPVPLWCTDPPVVLGTDPAWEGPFLIWMPLVPFKLNQNRRHHIPGQHHKMTN
jgi:hypothetical protein